MKKNILLYSAAILCVAIATFIGTLEPLVIKVTIDNVIGNIPVNSSNKVNYFINKIGGISYLQKNLWICGLTLVILTLVRGLFLYYRGKWSAKASENIAKSLRDKLYDHIQHLPYDYHVKTEAGDLIQRCTSDVETIRKFLSNQLVEMGRGIFILVFSLIVMFSLNVKMTLVSMSTVPIIFGFSLMFFSKIKDIFNEADEEEGKMTTVLQENLWGVRVVRAFGREKYEIDKFDNVNKRYQNILYKLYSLLGTYWSVSDFLCMIQIASVLIFGIYFTLIGDISLGTLVVFLNYEIKLLWPVRQLGRILSEMGKMTVAKKRIYQILNEKVEEDKEGEKKPKILGNIEFKDVHFEYDKGQPILNGISFKINKGEKVAIVGQTGSGKSSLIHLLGRLYDYNGGSIKIDGVELREINKKWIRSNVGTVLQEPYLYSRNIEDNIKIAKKDATKEEVIFSARNASVHEVIESFEKGYETMLGEKGVNLSGGQRQRIAIARTLIKSSPILIFDDSLSAVDTETDRKIKEALKEKSKGVTTIIISHRISSIMDSDKIIVLDKGKIAQMGSHNELIKVEGIYKRIWDIQKSIENEWNDTIVS
ncbi:ABC transporter ATP-binding protein/permease [Clostridium sp. MSJ-11]|uniref:ABC transporter ATP-binding protein/permease n=1 Tax=Clostridium mobile TaxID=2841512 RepID=A0ABS6EEG1_9CLOT|nr:ABC transporter ATP-binding protein [Clostridium mobile]MBU5482860.1 ABC transporter ATP-binding protein/permease [Clostridium mobile]